MPVAIIIDEGATGIPAYLRSRLNQTGLLGHVGEFSVAIVAIEHRLAIVGNKQIVAAIVVVVANAAGLSPAGLVLKAGTCRYIGECAVAVVLEQVAMRLLSTGKSFESPAIDEKEIEPAVIVIIVKGKTAS